MVVTNNDITQKNYKKLSIQVSLSGLSFCVLDLLSNTVQTVHSVVFLKNSIIEEALWKVFIDFPILTQNYDEVIVLHDNNLNTFVPNSLFDEKYLGSYLQYNVKVFETDLFGFDVLASHEMNNVFVPYVNVNNFLLDQYSTFNYKHKNSVLVERLLNLNNSSQEKEVYVHFQSNYFEIIVVKGNKLIFFNSFEYSSPEDFIYYILFTFEQLQLNPESISVKILGTISKDSDYFAIAYKYIRNCTLFDSFILPSTFGKTEEEIRNHFILFHT